jgi:hypothetical protein
MRESWTILAAAVAVAALGTQAAAAGWVVRMCRSATEASGINVWVVKSEGAEKPKPWLAWKSDDVKTDFPVPANLAGADQLWIQAESVPEGGKFSLCTLFDGTVTAHIHATNADGQTISKTARDDTCPCAKGQ